MALITIPAAGERVAPEAAVQIVKARPEDAGRAVAAADALKGSAKSARRLCPESYLGTPKAEA